MAVKDRGFASMDKSVVKEIASKGGRAAHLAGVAHQWNKETARKAAMISVANRKLKALQAQ